MAKEELADDSSYPTLSIDSTLPQHRELPRDSIVQIWWTLARLANSREDHLRLERAPK